MRILTGKYKGKSLKTFSNHSIRPTSGLVKEAFFNICASHIKGAVFLDLFAGIGGIGFEALSRGAAHVVFVDNSPRAVRLLHANSQLLDTELPITILKQDVKIAMRKLVKMERSFDLIYIDPPYELENAYVSSLLEEITKYHILNTTGMLVLENASHEEILIPGLVLRRKRKLGGTSLSEYCNTRNITLEFTKTPLSSGD
ncbi:16S rRNA (guanine(966)-N(2))-methyltransferase RsmD [Candidatus Chlamydia sanziniae]|uniref:16S rRNA guanine-methyltransferase n=1 Tax=Candidatus Chlamydia sanziniae TaxID=1806891 RepID=A0A1A9HWI6_9CHLA|nr:16S rRNA (guanine(966)-N(2))-methyltransferase RsmD [Candidatus Chlamydia sanziniae]ANH78404.1 16S rRNA guanine-methyltransferase [Candidatus Chlamydia sanziniae]